MEYPDIAFWHARSNMEVPIYSKSGMSTASKDDDIAHFVLLIAVVLRSPFIIIRGSTGNFLAKESFHVGCTLNDMFSP